MPRGDRPWATWFQWSWRTIPLSTQSLVGGRLTGTEWNFCAEKCASILLPELIYATYWREPDIRWSQGHDLDVLELHPSLLPPTQQKHAAVIAGKSSVLPFQILEKPSVNISKKFPGVNSHTCSEFGELWGRVRELPHTSCLLIIWGLFLVSSFSIKSSSGMTFIFSLLFFSCFLPSLQSLFFSPHCCLASILVLRLGSQMHLGSSSSLSLTNCVIPNTYTLWWALKEKARGNEINKGLKEIHCPEQFSLKSFER